MLSFFVHDAIIAPDAQFPLWESAPAQSLFIGQLGTTAICRNSLPNLIHPDGAVPSRQAKEFCNERLSIERYLHFSLLTPDVPPLFLFHSSFSILGIPFSRSTHLPFEKAF